MVVKHVCFRTGYHHQSRQSLALAEALAQEPVHAVEVLAAVRVAVVPLALVPVVVHYPSYQKTVEQLVVELPAEEPPVAVLDHSRHLEAD